MKYKTILPNNRITGEQTDVCVLWTRISKNEIAIENVFYTEKGFRKKAFDEKMLVRIYFDGVNMDYQKTVTAANFENNEITIIAQ
jgi:hypothetical protein